jgi:hypothetical protein
MATDRGGGCDGIRRLDRTGHDLPAAASTGARWHIDRVQLPHHGLVVPAWRELQSGLLVPSSVADRLQSTAYPVDVPPELLGPPAPLAVVDHMPVSADQLGGAINERELGLEPPADLDELIEKAQALPFEPSFLLIARIAAELWHMREDAERQLDLVRRFNMPNLVAKLEDVLVMRDGRARRYVFAEQYLTVLQRVLVEHARERTLAEGASDDELRATISAYFASASVTSAADAHLQVGEPTAEEWLVYLIKNGAYNTRSPNVNVVTRARELFVELPARLVDDHHYCRIDDWFREDYGLDAAEQHAVGFALYVLSGALDEEVKADDPSVVRPPFGDGPLADRQEQIADLVGAPQQWYADEFAAAGDDLDSIAWERSPFLRRPFLRLADGRWLLTSPRAIDSWLGEGFYYRALESARRRGSDVVNRFFTFFGKLVETYCLDLVRSVYAGERPIGGGRVYDEQRYGPHGGKRTSDVTIDLGFDLVLIEVVSARFATDVRVYGDPEILTAALERMLFKKMRQLGRVATAVLTGEATIPDVDANHVERVWPVVVVGGDLMHTELLWDRIEAELPPELRDGRVQALTVLDIEDYELLLGLVSEGRHLPDVLRQKAAGAYRRLGLNRFMHEELHLPLPLLQRPPVLEERWTSLGETMKGVLFPGAAADGAE